MIGKDWAEAFNWVWLLLLLMAKKDPDGEIMFRNDPKAWDVVHSEDDVSEKSNVAAWDTFIIDTVNLYLYNYVFLYCIGDSVELWDGVEKVLVRADADAVYESSINMYGRNFHKK